MCPDIRAAAVTISSRRPRSTTPILDSTASAASKRKPPSYVPISSRSVLSVRGRLAVSTTADGQQVPFYELPALGNAHSLRAYSSYRFRDRDLVLFNAEYRWPLLRMLDGAIFCDAGNVAPTLAGLARRSLIADYGAGVRLHSKKRLIVRMDVARGREGMQALVSFSPVLSSSTRALFPYVP